MGITFAELTAQIRADGAATATSQIKQVGVAGDETSKKIIEGNEKTSMSFKDMVKNAAVVAGALYAIRKASDVLLSSIRTARDFEAAIADLSAITGATGDDLAFLAQKSREFGASTTLSATQAAEAFKLIASAKPDLLENAEALATVTKEAIILAEAAGSTLPEAASTLGSSLNQFGADADQAGRFINVLAAGAKFGASEIADTASALRDSGTVAASAGISFEELNASIQALSTVSIKGSRAGVGLRNIILKLQKEGAVFSKETGGLTGALQKMLRSGIETTEVMQLFGLENVTAAQALIDHSGKLQNLTEKLTGTGIAYEQARTKVNTLKGDTKKLSSAWEEFQLTLIGSTGSLRSIVQGTTEGVLFLTESMDTLAIAGAAVASVIVGQLTKATAGYATNIAANIKAQQASTAATVANAKASTVALGVKSAYAAAELKEAQAAVIAATGVQRLTLAENTLIPAQHRAAAAANAHTASLARLSTASATTTAVAGGLRGVMALLGGPVGVITAAATALSFWALNADDATKSTDNISDSMVKLAKDMSSFDLARAIKDTRDQLDVYQKALESVRSSAPGNAGIARVAVLEELISNTRVKLADMGKSLDELRAKEKEIADIASGVNTAKTKPVILDQESSRKEIDALQKSLLTQKQLIEENYLERTFLIESKFDDEVIASAERAQLLIGIEKDKNERLNALNSRTSSDSAGGSVADTTSLQINARMESIKTGFLTEEALLLENRDRQKLYVEQWISEDFSREEEGNNALLSIQKRHEDDLTSLQAKKQQARLSLASNFFGGFAALAQAAGSKSFKIFKGFAIAETLVSTYAAAQLAYQSQFLPVPDYTSPARGAVAAAGAVAGGLARLISIKSATPGGGGGGGGGGGSGGSAPPPGGSSGINQNFIPSAQRPDSERERGTLTVIFQGDMIGWDEHIRERVITDIRDLVDNQDVILVSNTSRNAQELALAGT